MEVYDFGGYATRSNLRCSDGRTILPNAFKHMDGQKVPLVWQHQRNTPENCLGYAVLENRNDGMYCYGKFNENPRAQQVKHLVEHGDITSLSIFANDLTQKNKNVSHGNIKEVSLVYSGANPGAFIDNLAIQHDDGSIEEVDGEAIIYSGMDFDVLEHSIDEDEEDEMEHAETTTRTAKQIFDSMDDDQKNLVYALVAHAMEDRDDEDEDEDGDSASHSDDDGDEYIEEGENYMQHNVFEGSASTQTSVVTEKDVENIFANAKKTGSLKTATQDYLQHMADEGRLAGYSEDFLEHGIENLEILFPEAKAVSPTPEMIMRQQSWVSTVWNGTKKVPFSRVKTVFADITKDEARARGYIKGNRKVEEQFGLLKRYTTPQTVYKLQSMDRDDQIDITDFDVVAWMKAEMRLMLNEELSRAVILGDGRQSGDADKINETNIRPIWKDEDLYTIHAIIPKAAMATATDRLALSDLYIDTVASAMEDYEGSGSPICFMAPGTLTAMKMARDKIGRRLYNTDAEVAAALGVSKIVPVPLMKGDVNIREGREGVAAETGKHFRLDMLIVNLSDYTIGADRGGAVSLFDDFDIDYNRYKYLIETRCSGALTKPYSAIAVETEVDLVKTVTVGVDDPSQNRFGKKVSELQRGIVLHTGTYYGTLKYVDGYTKFSNDVNLQKGHYLSLTLNKDGEDDVYTKIIGGNGDWKKVDDGFCVYYIRDPKTQKIAVQTRNGGNVTSEKVYTLYGLTMGEA